MRNIKIKGKLPSLLYVLQKAGLVAMKDLEEIDVKILKELLKDGRKSFTTIAKECHISKDIVWKHYKDMKEVGIIVGATIQFNYLKFGYTGVARMMLSVESQYVTDVFERLKKIPGIVSFRLYNSTYNLAAIAELKSLRDLECVKELISKHNIINEINTCLWTDVRNIPENIFVDRFENKTEKANESSQTGVDAQKSTVKIDEIDMQIVKKLTKEARSPFSKIAQEIGASTDTVARRYGKLRRDNFIKVLIQINPLELGYQAIIDINIALANQSKTKEVVDKLSIIPGVAYIIKITGNYDVLVVALVKDCKDIISINEEIVKIPYIKNMEAAIRQVYPAWPSPSQSISTF
ncbi:MAG: Lrp/AsnC family transcriptional regulator [Candidatus Bathyarchaeia archaeon]